MFRTLCSLKSYQKFLIPSQMFNFSTTNAKEFIIKSVPGHKAPANEENAPSRYASVLFTSASKKEALFDVLEDMKHLKEITQTSEIFRDFLINAALKRHEQMSVFESLAKDKYFHQTTLDFIGALIDNKRLDDLTKIIEKYIEYYRILNKEQNIRIISAKELNQSEKDKVVAALTKSNPGINFTVKYEIDGSILGGLQMYNGNNFMDLSLLSRIDKVKNELNRISI